MSQSEEGPDQVSDTTSAAGQTEGPAVGGNGEPVAQESQPVAQENEPVAQESEPVAGETEPVADETDGQGGGGKGKVAAAAAGTGAAVAGIAGGIAVASRDTRRRVLGIPLGKRSRFQRTASTVVDKAKEPARRLGSRFSRD